MAQLNIDLLTVNLLFCDEFKSYLNGNSAVSNQTAPKQCGPSYSKRSFQEVNSFSGLRLFLPNRKLVFLLINAQMPTIVGIIISMSRKNFMLS